MSQPLHESIDVPDPANNTGDPQYLPQSARNQEPRGISDHVDGSGPIFSLYLEMATEEDKKMVENWKEDADGILIFTGLFSAAVASLISVSIQDLQQNPQDTSNFYLANMYQSTINPNSSNSLPASPPPFTPPSYAVWVNALWFLSLVISITCALLATLLQQWARRYLKVTQPRYSPHKRARIRVFFAEGVDKFLLPWAVEALPTMLHLSLFLFFAGLSVFLWNVNLTIFKLVLSWIGLCTALYGCITFIPIFCHDSPYHTPLSLPVWQFTTGIPFVAFRALKSITFYFDFFSAETYHHFRRLAERYGILLAQGMRKIAEEAAFGSPPEIDTRMFVWTFDSLDEDHELERFFAGLPGFCSSKMVHNPLPDLTEEQKQKLFNTWVGLLDRTSSSNLLPELAKLRRIAVCAKAIGPAGVPGAIKQLGDIIVARDLFGPVQSAEIAHSLRGWANGQDKETTMIIRAVVLSVVAREQRHDDLWFAMASDEVCVPESVLRNHAAHGNDLSLAILIHIIRRQFSLLWEQHWPSYEFSKVLLAASKFDVLNTSPELQHEFCALWNQVTHKVTHGAGNLGSRRILRPIRNIYLTLHLHTDSAPTAFSASTGDKDFILLEPSSYPLCNIPGHHLDLTPLIHDATTATATARSVLPDDAVLVPSSFTSTPDTPTPSVPASIHFDKSPVDVPPLDNISVPASLYHTHQPAAESVRNFATSPDLAAAAAIQENTSARIMPPTDPENSKSTSSVSPPAGVSPQNMVRSGAPEIPSSASPELVLDDTTGTLPWPASVPLLDTAEGGIMAVSHHVEDTPDLPLENCTILANTVAFLDRPPPAPTLPLATDITVASPSQQGLDAEHTGDQPHDASHGQYDIE